MLEVNKTWVEKCWNKTFQKGNILRMPRYGDKAAASCRSRTVWVLSRRNLVLLEEYWALGWEWLFEGRAARGFNIRGKVEFNVFLLLEPLSIWAILLCKWPEEWHNEIHYANNCKFSGCIILENVIHLALAMIKD